MRKYFLNLAKNDKKVYHAGMNPLFILWIFVFAICALLAVVFYLADHYPDTIGNFYFLLSVFLISYGLYCFANWIRTKYPKGVDFKK